MSDDPLAELRDRITAQSTNFDLDELADEIVSAKGWNKSHVLAYLDSQRRLLRMSPSMRHQGRQK